MGLWALVAALVIVAMGSGGAMAALNGEQAQVHAAGQPSGCDNPPGTCKVNPKTGCPDAGPQTIESGQRCVPLQAELKFIVTQESGGGCVGNDYIQVKLVPGLVGWEAVWIDSYGSRWMSGLGTVGPGTVTGEGATYKVPKGYAAWSAGGGASASGDCPGPPGSQGVKGWGVPGGGCLLAAPDTGSGTSATTAAGKHCTTTTVKCPNGVNNLPEECVAVVTDTNKHPVVPTGFVRLRFLYTLKSGTTQSAKEDVDLHATPGHSKKSSIARFAWGNVEAGSYSVFASYPGDGNHKHSKSGTSHFGITSAPSRFLTAHQDAINVYNYLCGLGGLEVIYGARAKNPVLIEGGAVTCATGAIINFVANLGGSDAADATALATALVHAEALAAAGSSVGRADTTVLADAMKLQALDRTLRISVARAVSAERTGRHKVRTAALHTATKDLDRMASLVNGLISAQKKLAQALHSAHPGAYSAPLHRLQAIQAKLAKHLPSSALKLFHKLGLTPAQISLVKHTLGTVPLQASENFSAALTSPALIAAERKLTSALRALGKNPAPAAYPRLRLK